MGNDPFGNGPFGINMFNLMFTLVPLFIGVVFVFVFGSMIWRAVRYARAPLMSAPARLVAKRTSYSSNNSSDGGSTGSTSYHGTFELADGQRLELGMDGRDYGTLAEGDTGILNWRDSVFKGFQRNTQLARGANGQLDSGPTQVGKPLF